MRVKIYEFVKRGIVTNAIHKFIKTIVNCFVDSCGLTLMLMFFSGNIELFTNEVAIIKVVEEIFFILLTIYFIIWILKKCFYDDSFNQNSYNLIISESTWDYIRRKLGIVKKNE